MADQIPIDTTKYWGGQLLARRNGLQQELDDCRNLLAKMTECVDGSDYTQLEAQFGIATGSGVTAYGEFSSAIGKLNTNASVDNVLAALTQMFAILG